MTYVHIYVHLFNKSLVSSAGLMCEDGEGERETQDIVDNVCSVIVKRYRKCHRSLCKTR